MAQPDLQTFQHGRPAHIGVLLTNLGSPDSPERPAVRRYLKEFLWDPRVVEIARPLWWLVLNAVILNTRPSRSAKAYQKVWTKEGSPLLHFSALQRSALADSLASRFGNDLTVALGMRYGKPSIRSALEELLDAGVRKLLVLPLYPQYSATTTASTFDAVSETLRDWRWLPDFRFVNHYHDEPAYIAALADSVRHHREKHGGADRLLLSFHGIPEEYFHKGDPYYCECQKTARLVAEALELDESQWQISFQSRLGPKKWLHPYTDHTLADLASNGVKSIQVLCPGFSADCLETLEEVAMENHEVFTEAGGERYEYIPCLNDSPAHIEMLAGLVERHTQGWQTQRNEPHMILQRAAAQGASR